MQPFSSATPIPSQQFTQSTDSTQSTNLSQQSTDQTEQSSVFTGSIQPPQSPLQFDKFTRDQIRHIFNVAHTPPPRKKSKNPDSYLNLSPAILRDSSVAKREKYIGYLYTIQDPEIDTIYGGQTNDFSKRIKGHESTHRNPKTSNYKTSVITRNDIFSGKKCGKKRTAKDMKANLVAIIALSPSKQTLSSPEKKFHLQNKIDKKETALIKKLREEYGDRCLNIEDGGKKPPAKRRLKFSKKQ